MLIFAQIFVNFVQTRNKLFLFKPTCDATSVIQVRYVLGFGFGLMFIPGVVASSQHFVQRRYRSATSLIISSQLLFIVLLILTNLTLF